MTAELEEVVTICALRFKGYEYEEHRGLSVPTSTGAGLARLAEPIIADLVLHSDQNDNFAAFFGLQRFLCKWGGESLPDSSPERLAYHFLFLHLYRAAPSSEFCEEEYMTRWRREFEPQAERLAAGVRKVLLGLRSVPSPWVALPRRSPFVLPVDAVAVSDFNSVWAGTDFELQTHLVPIPFLGAKDAAVVILQANPGYDCVNDEANQCHQTFVDTVRACLLHEQLDYPFFLLDKTVESSSPKFTGTAAGHEYWASRLRMLTDEFGSRKVAQSLLCIQLQPYRSKGFKAPKREFPSQHYSAHLVKDAMRRGAVIIVMRCKRLWFEQVDGLESYEHVLVTRNPRSAFISAGNLPDGGFEKVRQAIQDSPR